MSVRSQGTNEELVTQLLLKRLSKPVALLAPPPPLGVVTGDHLVSAWTDVVLPPVQPVGQIALELLAEPQRVPSDEPGAMGGEHFGRERDSRFWRQLHVDRFRGRRHEAVDPCCPVPALVIHEAMLPAGTASVHGGWRALRPIGFSRRSGNETAETRLIGDLRRRSEMTADAFEMDVPVRMTERFAGERARPPRRHGYRQILRRLVTTSGTLWRRTVTIRSTSGLACFSASPEAQPLHLRWTLWISCGPGNKGAHHQA